MLTVAAELERRGAAIVDRLGAGFRAYQDRQITAAELGEIIDETDDSARALERDRAAAWARACAAVGMVTPCR